MMAMIAIASSTSKRQSFGGLSTSLRLNGAKAGTCLMRGHVLGRAELIVWFEHDA